MKLTTLQLSLGISLAAHAIFFGAMEVFGNRNAPVEFESDGVISLSIVDAPQEPPASIAKPVPLVATLPTPAPAPAVAPAPVTTPPVKPSPSPEPLETQSAKPVVEIARQAQSESEPQPTAPAVKTAPAVTKVPSASEPAATFSLATQQAVKTVAAPIFTPPRYRSKPEPRYPLTALRLHEEGTVLLKITVSPEGNPARIEIKKSSGFASLDNDAVKEAGRIEFEPARLGSLPVESVVEVPYPYRLKK